MEYFPDTDKFSLEESVYPQLISEGEMSAHATSYRYFDVGTPERLRLFEDYLEAGGI